MAHLTPILRHDLKDFLEIGIILEHPGELIERMRLPPMKARFGRVALGRRARRRWAAVRIVQLRKALDGKGSTRATEVATPLEIEVVQRSVGVRRGRA